MIMFLFRLRAPSRDIQIKNSDPLHYNFLPHLRAWPHQAQTSLRRTSRVRSPRSWQSLLSVHSERLSDRKTSPLSAEPAARCQKTSLSLPVTFSNCLSGSPIAALNSLLGCIEVDYQHPQCIPRSCPPIWIAARPDFEAENQFSIHRNAAPLSPSLIAYATSNATQCRKLREQIACELRFNVC
ncbi:uncharacterized protein BDR25DRAFT_356978 [Lindgomyces ingoldianus]|uniref:Uncharacterized protein n=1 Tax=Lindgomyces ingoldianus TaxID=673940 RepID=A0ACB6QSQ1_9PLEO|nr:uncharacterized protein BDR25DRAFT_356978 [Lindgomyces ingoldianus]KAF2469206.1 hypothetical protein BDR25DRAFT_356978 [Lindgomyces ingoldianus]